MNKFLPLTPTPSPAERGANLPLRSPDIVMKLDRLGSFHQTRISFVRSLLRKVMREQWQIERTKFDLDEQGYGTCIYKITVPAEAENGMAEIYSIVIFSQYLADADRTDRVIAEKWDVACVLVEGVPDEDRLAELRVNVPKQEAGRNRPDVLVLSRANKSTRNFSYFIDCLAQGQQPDPQVIAKVGYLLRTTAVYGNGKFGVADYDKVRQRRAFSSTFRAQMFAVFMIRHFSLELIEHLAQQKSPTTAVPLHQEIKRYVGVGNATGLGMAPFLISHPRLIHRWISARETAIARVLHTTTITPAHLEQLLKLLDKAAIHIQEIETDHDLQQAKNKQVEAELPLCRAKIQTYLADHPPTQQPATLWQELITWAVKHTSSETQELLNSLLLELYPEVVDDLENEMGAEENYDLQPEMSVAELIDTIEGAYQWALQIDYSTPQSQHFFWYRSLEKEEPRFGERYNEPGAEKETHIAISRTIQQLYNHLQTLTPAEQAQSIVHFLLKYPTYKGIIRRVQALCDEPYAEIRSNLIGHDCLPIHLLRCKLSFFGASKFDPKSHLWVRITLFQGAPLVSEIGQPFADDWAFPCMPRLETV